MLLDVIRIRHKKPWSKVFSSDCNFSCAACKRLRFWGCSRKPSQHRSGSVQRQGPLGLFRGSTASSTRCFASAYRSCELTRCSLFASASDQAKNGTNQHVDHAQPQHASAAHACVVEDTVRTRPWLCFCSWMGLRFESLLSVSLWSTIVRWLLIVKLTLLGFLPSTKPIFLRRPLRAAVVHHGIP